MPTFSPDVARPAAREWAGPGDRQEAARQAYRRSVADGRPLTGVELGARFSRSPRWGTSRIAEVRSQDISRSHADNAAPIASNDNRSTTANTDDRAALPIRNSGKGQATATAPAVAGKNGNGSAANGNGNPLLPTGNSGNGAHADSGSTTRPSRPNGNHRADAALPTRSNANSSATLPIGNNGKGNLAGRSADREPPAGPPPDCMPAVGDLAATPAVRRITTVAVLAVALVAGVASYDHQRVLAHVAGEGWRAYLLPLSVDGLIVAASMSMLVRRRAGQPAGALAWCALLLGLAASLAANVVAADPELLDPVLVSRVVAAWPPIALGLSFELSIGQLRPASPRSPRRQ